MQNKTEKPCIVGIGEILWDMFPAGRQLGGAPTNFAFHAASLGAEGIPVSAVGDDEAGRDIIETVSDLGLNDTYISISQNRNTGMVSVSLDSEGVPAFTIHQDVAWDCIPFSAELNELAKEADAVCYGSLAQRSEMSRQTIRTFIRATNDRCLRVFDVNLRQSFYSAAILQETMAMSDILKLNAEELSVIGPLCVSGGSEDEMLRALFEEYRPEMVVLTKGNKGSRLFCSDYDQELPAAPVPVEDTVGAGDAFTAALVVGLLKKVPVEKIHRCATELAAFVCSRRGATPERSADLDSIVEEICIC